MRLLILADIHGSLHSLPALEDELARAELILIAGDLTEFGGEKEAEELIRPLARRGAALAAVPGNCDRSGARRYLERAGISAEGRLLRAAGLEIVGAGGGLLRTGLTPYERSEEELEETLRAALAGRGSGPLLVLSHTPPYGTEADLRRGAHVGSTALRDILDEERPLLWVSGHIHEARSISSFGGTTLINPGSLNEGYFARGELLGERAPYRLELELAELRHQRHG